MKIVTVIGARPQFIKAAIVSNYLRESDGVTEVLVHTGQHYDHAMSDVFFEELGLDRPRHSLDVSSASHGVQTARMLERLEPVLEAEKPDTVLVYGDTNSTLAGALTAAKLHIPVAHVEAGMRSFNRAMPEEINRVLTDHLAAQNLAPTQTAVENLAHEGITEGVNLVGDVMYDASVHFGAKAAESSRVLQDNDLSAAGYVLATLHRAENTDDPARLKAIVAALAQTAETRPVVLPLHPRTAKQVAALGMADALAGITVIEPVGYLDMQALEHGAMLVVTDSGGVQKEAFFHGVPCVTVRTETEWVELVACGWNRLADPADSAAISQAIADSAGAPPSERPGDLYGGGQAAARTAAILSGTGG